MRRILRPAASLLVRPCSRRTGGASSCWSAAGQLAPSCTNTSTTCRLVPKKEPNRKRVLSPCSANLPLLPPHHHSYCHRFDAKRPSQDPFGKKDKHDHAASSRASISSSGHWNSTAARLRRGHLQPPLAHDNCGATIHQRFHSTTTTANRAITPTGESNEVNDPPTSEDSATFSTANAKDDDDDEHVESGWIVDWNIFMTLLRRFHQEHSHCFVPRNYQADEASSGLPAKSGTSANDKTKTCTTTDDDESASSSHTDGGRRYPLGAWVHQVRSDTRRKQPSEQQQQPLTSERKSQLNSLDFEWNLLEAQWMTQFHLLCQYQQQHGDCLVPRHYVTPDGDYHLGDWVGNQRKDRRKMLDQGGSTTAATTTTTSSPMTRDRMCLLDSIGFDWNPLETHWNTQYEWLCRYQHQHGHCRVPQRYSYQGNRLGKWVQEARQQYRKYREAGGSRSSFSARMTPERIQLLEQIGFDWNPLETYWCEMHDKLVQFRDANGHWPSTSSSNRRSSTQPQEAALARWVQTQRDAYRKYQQGQPAKITAERIERLDAIGFSWKPTRTRATRTSSYAAKKHSTTAILLAAEDESEESTKASITQ